MRLPAYLLAAVCLFTMESAHALDTGVVGTWRGPENSVISIAPCGGALCARVMSTGDETAARIDTNNPNATLRTRPLCGLQIGEGFHGTDPNKAEGGHLYDPRTGKTYKGSMVSQGDVLLLRGYVGVSMFGRTARWERVTAPVEMCSNTQPKNTAPPAAVSSQPSAGDTPTAPANTRPAGSSPSAPAGTTPPANPAPAAPQATPATPAPATTPKPQ